MKRTGTNKPTEKTENNNLKKNGSHKFSQNSGNQHHNSSNYSTNHNLDQKPNGDSNYKNGDSISKEAAQKRHSLNHQAPKKNPVSKKQISWRQLFFGKQEEAEQKPMMVVDRERADKWFTNLQNKYLKRGFRKNYNSISRCLKSIFHVHNELLNIWTHIVGMALSLCILIYIYFEVNDVTGIEGKISADFHHFFDQTLDAKFFNEFCNDSLTSSSIFCQGQEILNPRGNFDSHREEFEQISSQINNYNQQFLVKQITENYLKFQNLKDNQGDNDGLKVYRNKYRALLLSMRDNILEKIMSGIFKFFPFYNESQELDIPLHQNRDHKKVRFEKVEKWPLELYQISAFLTFLGSTCFHTFNSISERLYFKLIRLDYAGITTVLTSGCVSIYYYSFFCDTFYFYFYITSTLICGSAVLILSLCDFIHQLKYHKIRSSMYGIFSLLLTVPTVQAIVRSNSIKEGDITDYLTFGYSSYYYLGILMSGFGGLFIYMSRIPERFAVSKFDIVGHSHQFWHLCCLVLIYCGHMASLIKQQQLKEQVKHSIRANSPYSEYRSTKSLPSKKVLQKRRTNEDLNKLENGFKLPPINSNFNNSGNIVNNNGGNANQQMVKKKVFSASNIKEAQQQKNNYDFLARTGVEKSEEEETEKMNTFFKFKVASLLHSLWNKQYYLQINEENKKKRNSQKVNETIEQQLYRLKKIVATKARYRYREKCEFQKSLIVQTLNINFQDIILKMNEDKMALDKFYEDLEDDYSELEKIKGQNGEKKDSQCITMDNLVHYKRKKGLTQNQKVFIIVGGYQSLQKSLMEMGWVENPDKNSCYFDMKWTCKSKDIDYNSALDCQFINHYLGNGCLSSKQGLAKNLKNLVWYENMDFHSFYPRCFDLNDQQEFEDFLEEFKFTKADANLQLFAKQNRQPQNDSEKCILQLCIAALNRKNKHVMKKIQEINLGIFPVISSAEWQLIQQYSAQNPEKLTIHESKIKKIQSKIKRDVDLERENFLEYAKEILEQQELNNPQYHMQGDKNLWVVKPAGLSRGRGIRSFRTMEPLLTYVFCKDIQWVAQKYLERVYLIDEKKFDIRQWVIVTDFNPITIFYYDECYLRICTDKYDENDLNNKFAHMVNNSIQKKQEKFEEKVEETMMTGEEFRQYLIKKEGQDLFKEIKKKMIKAIVNSIKAVQESVVYRKNSFEMLGYDFMIDTQFNPWLIEINTSPSMEYSTSVTKRLVTMGLADTGKLIGNYLTNNGRRLTRDTDIGLWRVAFRETKDKQ